MRKVPLARIGQNESGWWGLVVVFVALVTGCGEPSVQQPTYPVTGEVKLEGQPVPNATIVFHPTDPTQFKWQEQPQGVTDAEGKFSLFTYSANDGAPAGEYRVGIVTSQIAAEEGGDQVKRSKGLARIPLRYADPKTSGLTATVKTESTRLPSFELSAR